MVWALLLGAGVIALAGTVLMPSTKRARIDLDRFRGNPPSTSTTEPAIGPTTRG